MSVLLEVSDLRVTLATARGPVDALRGVSFTLDRGATLGLIGESGCGKSMTALALMGLLPEGSKVSGSMRFDGRELTTLDEDTLCELRGDRIAMVFQEPMTALNPLHPVGRQIAEPLRLHRGLDAAAARAEALRLMERVRLPHAKSRLDAYPHQLSGGQRQRVVIAIALACGPDLLIADELRRDSRMALLLIGHNLDLMAARVEHLAVMYGGAIVESGPTQAVFERRAHPYTRGLFAARPQLGSDRNRPLSTIPGRVPALHEMPAGCAFADRCTLAIDECRAAMPAQATVSHDHNVRCIRWEHTA